MLADRKEEVHLSWEKKEASALKCGAASRRDGRYASRGELAALAKDGTFFLQF